MELATSLGWLWQIFDIFDISIDPDTRWNNLQKWLEQNPDKKEFIDTLVRLPADQAYVYTLDTIGISESLLKSYDPLGFIQSRAVSTIQKLQSLYSHRKQFSDDGRRVGSPGAKRKKKTKERIK